MLRYPPLPRRPFYNPPCPPPPNLQVAGKGVEEGVRAGHYAASIVVQRSGCTFPDLPYNFSWA